MSHVLPRARAGRAHTDYPWRCVRYNLVSQQRKSVSSVICSSSWAQYIIVYVQSKTKTNLFFSFSTRESLASNTSSIVESNRRQNPALSPAHGGAGPNFNFRASTDPPTNEAEKLQKPSNCLQASVTSVWLSSCLGPSVSFDTATFTTIGTDVYISAKTNISSTAWGSLELCR